MYVCVWWLGQSAFPKNFILGYIFLRIDICFLLGTLLKLFKNMANTKLHTCYQCQGAEARECRDVDVH